MRKVCERCGKMYYRTDLSNTQRDAHWRERKFCTDECRIAARSRVGPDGTLRCSKCREYKSRDAFHAVHTSATGVRSRCKECVRQTPRKRLPTDVVRDRNLRAFYGITLEQYNAMSAEQGGVCAICGESETATNYRNGDPLPLAVDHCHDTGQVRALLCTACNNGLGRFAHDAERLAAAAEYLRRHRHA